MGVVIVIVLIIVAFVAYKIFQKWKDDKDLEWKFTKEPGVRQNELKELAESDAEAQATTETDANKLLSLGLSYKVCGEYKKAAAFFAKAALQDHMVAQFHLGYIYSHGEGVEQDYVKARYWYECAADQGDADAQNNLGLLYFDGKGGDENKFWALEWLEKAAKQGHKEAERNLSNLDFHIERLMNEERRLLNPSSYSDT